mgnify:CR=1 FL=1
MNNFLQDIAEFHKKFNYHQSNNAVVSNDELMRFRINFIQEELDELKDAVIRNNSADALDALVDLTYIILGTAWLYNLPFAAAWKAVHEANMKKVRGKSDRSETYDCVKPNGWQAPDINKILMEGRTYD